MKSLTLMAIYIASFILIFLMMSFVVCIFVGSYEEVINTHSWQAAYALFFGWWLAFFPAREYYMKNKEEFDMIF